MRLIRNCAGDPQGGAQVSFSFDPELRQCPWTAIPGEAFEWVERHRLFTLLAILPYGGASMGDQPQRVIEAFALCGEAREAMREIRAQRARAEDRQPLLAVLQGLSGRR